MDGNGRWAAQRKRPRVIGHRAGTRAVNRCIDFCLREGVQALTLFAFSSENWQRPAEEVGALMRLFLSALEREVDELHRRNVRLRFIGERNDFSAAIRTRIASAETLTAGNHALHLSIAAGYGGRWDITQACRRIAEDVRAGRMDPAAVDESLVAQRLALADLPEPDLFIRTGGEQRVSNFLLWQLAYTELWFTDTLWPDVNDAMLATALADYARRERRFGLTGAQVDAQPARDPRP